MHKKFIFALLSAALSALPLSAQKQNIDTVYVSDLYTTHLIFPTDIMYADLSNRQVIMAKIVDQMKNTLAIRAKEEFSSTANVSLTESNGVFHTYILKFARHPDKLYIDTRLTIPGTAAASGSGSSSIPVTAIDATLASKGYSSIDQAISALRREDAPELQEVINSKRDLYHLTSKKQKVSVSCNNIFAYSDITYFILEINNKSGVSYETKDATFVIEDNENAKRKVKPEPVALLPKNRFGSLTAAVGAKSKIAYSFDKITLAPDQVLKIYIYEKGGQRNHALTLAPDDINLAAQPQ